MATQLDELLDATAQTRSILKATGRVTRAALQLVTDLEERVAGLEADLRTAIGQPKEAHRNADHEEAQDHAGPPHADAPHACRSLV